MTNISQLAAEALDPASHAAILALMVHQQTDVMGDFAISLCEALYAHLVVIIGHEGFNALYDRCLHQTSQTFSWLDPAESAPSASRFEQLRHALQSQKTEDAANATVLLLSNFTRVLGTLIGLELTHIILRTAWGSAFEDASKEISQWTTK